MENEIIKFAKVLHFENHKYDLNKILHENLSSIIKNERDLLIYELGKIVGEFQINSDILQKASEDCFYESKKISSVLTKEERVLIKVKPSDYFTGKTQMIINILKILIEFSKPRQYELFKQEG